MPDQAFDVTAADGKTTLWVNSEQIEECIKHYQSNAIDRLGVNPQRGYNRKDIDFLRSHPDITALVLVGSTTPFELEPLEHLRRLRSLTISFQSRDLHLDRFPELEEFRGYWHPNLQLADCRALRILDLSGYAPKSKDLSQLPFFPSLQQLSMTQAALTSLRGASRFYGLRRIELAYLSKLESLHDAEQLQLLEVLDCQKCRKLRDHDIVRSLTNLRVLRFNDCGEIPNLNFIDEIPSLEEFRFVGTNIADGNLGPLLRLKRVGFIAKKHYSYTPEQLDELLRPHGGSAIPRIEN